MPEAKGGVRPRPSALPLPASPAEKKGEAKEPGSHRGGGGTLRKSGAKPGSASGASEPQLSHRQ